MAFGSSGAELGHAVCCGGGIGGLVWTEDALDHFLADPYSVPDNGMEFSGLPNAADRKAVIDYIKSAPH